jgi:1-aminocyclopropane-1-carboxylate deaminase
MTIFATLRRVYMKWENKQIENQRLELIHSTTSELFIKKDYLNHPEISGNKYRKLKYNILKANEEKLDTLLTFGGAFSNHIAAAAAAGRMYNFKTIGVIRGEELQDKLDDNPTLKYAQSCGMTFKFVSRETYRHKTSEDFIESLKNEFGNVFVIPEGGTKTLAIKGCEEILTNEDTSFFDYVCCPVGSGGTIAGIINSSRPGQQILGFPALKGDFLSEVIRKFATKTNWQLQSDYHFGGYGKVSEELIAFINDFKKQTKIPLDPIYTGKMVFGVLDLMHQGFFPKDSKILMIHTGGLQGILGMNQRLKQKQLPLIE